jgi:hypothetical protein
VKLTSQSIADGQPIKEEFAFGAYDPVSTVKLVGNKSPDVAWTDIPDGTESFVLTVHDPDVPSRPDDVNKTDRTVPYDLPRVDFFHWVAVDIPKTTTQLDVGAGSLCVVAKGKPGPDAFDGARHGINDYTNWFAGDPDMGGDYYGYDGPCPPFNDERLHNYVFTIYALDVARCPVEGKFTGQDVRTAIEGHILGQASFTGTYHIYPEARR